MKPHEHTSSDERRLSRYQTLLLEQFGRNRASRQNPDGLLLYGFVEDHLDELTRDVELILQRLSRPFVLVDCVGKRFREILMEVMEENERSGPFSKLYEEFEKRFQIGAFTLVLVRPSRMRDAGRSSLVRDILKMLDDAHFEEIYTMSDVIIVDRASFLEKGWSDIRPYVKVIPHASISEQWFGTSDRPILTVIE